MILKLKLKNIDDNYAWHFVDGVENVAVEKTELGNIKSITYKKKGDPDVTNLVLYKESRGFLAAEAYILNNEGKTIENLVSSQSQSKAPSHKFSKTFGVVGFDKEIVVGNRDADDDVLAEPQRQFLAQIEAMDNGQDMPELGAHVLAFVYTFNGTWIETSGSEEERRAFADKAFIEASDIATAIARRMLRRIVDDMAAEALVDDCIAKSKGRVITLDKYMPWKPSVIRENKRRKENGEMPFLLMLFPGLDGNYHIQTVPVDFHTFEDEMKLPEAWAGLEGDALAKATGLSDAVFCHKGRFMAIFKSKDSAIKAARMALDNVGAME